MSTSGFEFTTDVDIRFADLDAYGHVNNALFFTYLETARIKLFQRFFGEFLDSPLMFLVVRAECDYRLPITLNDRLVITLTMKEMRQSSFTFVYRLHDGKDREYATAATVMVSYDPVRKKPAAIPAPVRDAFAVTAA